MIDDEELIINKIENFFETDKGLEIKEYFTNGLVPMVYKGLVVFASSILPNLKDFEKMEREDYENLFLALTAMLLDYVVDLNSLACDIVD